MKSSLQTIRKQRTVFWNDLIYSILLVYCSMLTVIGVAKVGHTVAHALSISSCTLPIKLFLVYTSLKLHSCYSNI